MIDPSPPNDAGITDGSNTMMPHELALLLMEWPNGELMIEHEEQYYPTLDVECDLDGDIHLVTRG